MQTEIKPDFKMSEEELTETLQDRRLEANKVYNLGLRKFVFNL